jgi:hypothetical protein
MDQNRTTPQHVDELCTCGHTKSTHAPRYAPGHGPCRVCECKQFTFERFLSAQEVAELTAKK